MPRAMMEVTQPCGHHISLIRATERPFISTGKRQAACNLQSAREVSTDLPSKCSEFCLLSLLQGRFCYLSWVLPYPSDFQQLTPSLPNTAHPSRVLQELEYPISTPEPSPSGSVHPMCGTASLPHGHPPLHTPLYAEDWTAVALQTDAMQ